MPMARFPICGTRCLVGTPPAHEIYVLTIADMAVDQDNLRRKNEELIQAFREKSRKQLQTQELYDKLKRRAMLGQVQNAAGDAAEHTIQASVTANRFVDRVGNQPQRPIQPQLPNMQTGNVHPGTAPSGNNTASSRARDGGETWAGFSSQSGPQRNPISASALMSFY